MPAKRFRSTKATNEGRSASDAGYGLPSGNKGLLPWTWAEQRLEKSHNYWITSVEPDT